MSLTYSDDQKYPLVFHLLYQNLQTHMQRCCSTELKCSYFHEFELARLVLHKERYLAFTVCISYSKFLNDLQSRLVSLPFYENRKALISK